MGVTHLRAYGEGECSLLHHHADELRNGGRNVGVPMYLTHVYVMSQCEEFRHSPRRRAHDSLLFHLETEHAYAPHYIL